MVARVEISPSARFDLIGIGDYIRKDNPEAARRVVAMIIGRCASLSNFPERGRRYDEVYRALVIGTYIALYKVDGDLVSVVHILHGARDVARFLHRKPS